MKFIHLSDLHLGKRLNEYSLLEDQKYILLQILHVIDDVQPDAVLIAGDIYDKPIPPAEAVELFDDFLVKLAQRALQVFIISGNHDSPERLAFGNRLMDASGIHISRVYNGEVVPVTLEDEYGAVDIFLLPFVKPVHVRKAFPDETIESYTDAVRVAIEHMPVNPGHRRVILAHQFITGAERCESEETVIGGLDNVSAAVFDGFDYVALGHIHGPQNVESERIRYCGTPLKYSFSETRHHKSVTVVQLLEKGGLSVETVPLAPLRDMAELRGTYDELTRKSFYENTSYPEDYVHITLTDEDDVPEAVARLRAIYHNLMKLDYDNRRTRQQSSWQQTADAEQKTPAEMFDDLYEKQNGRPMSPVQAEHVRALVEEIWEEGAF